MDCEVVAIGTELLLGQVVDTNSAWLGQRLAEAGIPCYLQTKVGDNHDRIVSAVRGALERSDAVVCCGGLGPTQDDITREAVAEVMGVPLQRVPEVEERLRARFRNAFGGRPVPAINLKQADVPLGADPIEPQVGSAPGLICPVADKVVYLLPGVPAEMKEMFDRVVLPELLRRSGVTATIRSRFLRVWGEGESRVAEIVAPRLEALEGTPTTIAFLANITDGVRVRVTTRAEGEDAEEKALKALDSEEAELRALLGDAAGGVDDEGLEVSIAEALGRRHWRLAVAESLTAGLVAARLGSVPGASEWLVGGVVSYSDQVKREILGVGAGPVVSERVAAEMATGVARALRAEVGLSLTGVAGPTEQDGQPVGTVFVGVYLPESGAQVTKLALLRGGRQMVRERAATAALDRLRRLLLAGTTR
jgi:nicotinamide-nucleotide amidase